ncbi:MAG: hypothetical protein AAF404_12565, partial [Pseudomonadota bacterium]
GLAALLSGACATTANTPSQSEVINERLDSQIDVQVRGDIRHDVTDPQVARLWQESEIMRRGGELDAAQERLQKAIAITPDDAVLWSRAAEIELDQNSFLRAENYAAKSNFLATLADRQLRYRNWLIIKRAREGRGDLLGAREADLETSKLTAR